MTHMGVDIRDVMWLAFVALALIAAQFVLLG